MVSHQWGEIPQYRRVQQVPPPRLENWACHSRRLEVEERLGRIALFNPGLRLDQPCLPKTFKDLTTPEKGANP